jgi:serine/threonine-protein kinase HipA
MEICKLCLHPITNVAAHKFRGFHNRCSTELFGSLRVAPRLNVTTAQFYEAARSKKGLSISGAQEKFGACIVDGKLVIPPEGYLSTHIVKPCPPEYPELPANEHLSMRISHAVGVETAACGLIPFADDALAYVVKRYDRDTHGNRIHQEDMMQAMGKPNTEDASKYKGSYEAVARKLGEIRGAGLVESAEFVKRAMLMYLVGNGDFHLKNTSLIYSKHGAPTLSPAYDAVNTTLYDDTQFLCLDFFEGDEEPNSYATLGYPSLNDFIEVALKVGIGEKTIKKFALSLTKKIPDMLALIENSLLSDGMKSDYSKTIAERITTLRP